MRNRSQEKMLVAKGLTAEEAAQVKALKKQLGFKNNSQLVNYLLDQNAHRSEPADSGQV
jgi:hypothetical protein